ncbi:cytoplasmic protein [Mesorhizobium sp. B2-5-3]|nr:cytoplasmic protein [Mesorhizobium sp. B2-5-3]
MATLAANQLRDYQLGDKEEYPVIAADIIYQGAAVGENGSGYSRPLVAGDPFQGFAEAIADNSAGAAGAINVNVKKKGNIVLPISGAAITTNDRPLVYASDDNTFTLTATSNSLIGTVSRWVSTGIAIVEFDAGLAACTTAGLLAPAA